MPDAFNLINEPWIPCIQAGGRPVELGLFEVLARAHELQSLHGETPIVIGALHRLLLAVLQRVHVVDGVDTWRRLWARGQWDAAPLQKYLAAWRARFDLFDAERPFFQVADSRVKPRPIAALVPDMASGKNATLFDHHTDQAGAIFTPAAAARALVTAQTFGLASLSGPLKQLTDAPCARGMIFFATGDTLFETLALNLLPYTAETPMPNSPEDRPAWEAEDPFAPDRQVPLGYLDYLTWPSRRVLLYPEPGPDGTVVRQATIAPGLRLSAEILDPMKHYRHDERFGLRPLRFREDRSIWRDSAVLYRLNHVEGREPLVFDWLSTLAEHGVVSRGARYRCFVVGMSNMQNKVHFYRAEHMPLSLDLLRDGDLVARLGEAVTVAEDVSRQLWGATRMLATLILAPDADRDTGRKPPREDLDRLMHSWNPQRRFWSGLEPAFWTLVDRLPADRDAALASWKDEVRRTAWAAFRHIERAVGADPRAMKGMVVARRQLAFGMEKAIAGSKRTAA